MKLSRMAFVLVSVASVTAAGVAAVACSSSTTPVTPPPNNTDSGMMAAMDSSMTAMDSTMTATDTGMMMMTGDTSMPATDAGCGNSPSLHPGAAGAGIYCPFGVGPDGGDLTLNCGADGGTANLCCVGGEDDSGTFPPSVCSAGSCTFTATSGNTQIQCEDPATDCPAGNVCCGAASKMHVVGPKAGCSYDSLTDWVYTKCEMGTACAATATAPGTGAEFQVCGAQGECPAGKTCTPFKAKGIDLGACL